MPSRQVGWGGGSEQIYHLTCGKFVNGETEHLTHAESVLKHNPPHCLGSLAMEFTIQTIKCFALKLDKGPVSTGSHKHDNINTWTSKNFVPYHKQVCGTSHKVLLAQVSAAVEEAQLPLSPLSVKPCQAGIPLKPCLSWLTHCTPRLCMRPPWTLLHTCTHVAKHANTLLALATTV